ncbi:hypothetical protein C9383_21935 [Pseudomonas palleroniana]|uniref:Uncharacterized protein n=1 Tax=Pseudomonas palleroniana TaxID=191390 RepID=A0A2T4FHG1_9PSED|nr:hypothetical protein F7R03_14600 [Pseudomonas palleroniana]NCE84956.1 hypothetical protein [Pseudomonas sp. Q1]PTC22834.1 hypothetical protein C9383_21935 [Pseudomonas palleroniana]
MADERQGGKVKPILWRASLLALRCEALPKGPAPASPLSGSKLPRHRRPFPPAASGVESALFIASHPPAGL